MKEELDEQAAVLGGYYLDRKNKVEFVVHRDYGPERFIVDRQQVKDFIEGKVPFVEFARVIKRVAKLKIAGSDKEVIQKV